MGSTFHTLLTSTACCQRSHLIPLGFPQVLLSRPGAENSANYEISEFGSVTYTKNVADINPVTMKSFVAYTASGQAEVICLLNYSNLGSMHY